MHAWTIRILCIVILYKILIIKNDFLTEKWKEIKSNITKRTIHWLYLYFGVCKGQKWSKLNGFGNNYHIQCSSQNVLNVKSHIKGSMSIIIWHEISFNGKLSHSQWLFLLYILLQRKKNIEIKRWYCEWLIDYVLV